MSEHAKRRLSIAAIITGFGLLVVGVAVAHFSGLPPVNDVGQELYPHVPRCLPFESQPKCWVIPLTGMATAFLGSQLMVAGLFFGWIYGKPMTWARATVAALLFTIEMIAFFGIVPNQWLSLTQGTFEWTAQKIAFTIPSWLVLNNEVSVSYGVIKDAVAGGYSATVLGVVAVGAYQIQERAKRAGQAPPPKESAYGRPVVKGEA